MAFFLMAGAAVLEVVGAVAAILMIGEIRDAVRSELAEGGERASDTFIDGVVIGAVSLTAVVAVVCAGLWLWMAFKNRAGRNWARIAGTVLFALNSLSVVSGGFTNASGSVNGTAFTVGAPFAATVINVVIWAVGLAVVILLWTRPSSAYFKPVNPYGAQPLYGPRPPGQERS
ncbi:hypothetical protein [Spirillospora sp. CA-294931]|uniref:hypothetical protein n=1 Tax=Spirillospora sp. CA-294931 TaxID=3240042 RepID=UPI003D92891B